jgi:outer membrane protein OmpA-like peptidoglycan-associated protein
MLPQHASVYCFLLLYFTFQSIVFAQQALPGNEPYAIVVGVFKIDQNAKAYCQSVIARGLDASIDKDIATGMNYVRVGSDSDKASAIEKVLRVRLLKGFEDTWIKTHAVSFEDDTVAAHAMTPVFDTEEPSKATEVEISNVEIFLHLYNAANDKLIEGTVEVIDTERGRLIEKAKGNTYYLLPDPKSRSKRITLIGDVFGYRKMQTEISYPIAPSDSANANFEMVGTIIMIRFDMVRYSKGDINVLYNVYFFNDASAMQPESRYELNNLLEMMKENEKYRIKLHGHSNGNYAGKIYEPSDKDHLFTLAGATQTSGSAKVLSYKRAQVIKDFLTANGIDEKRIEVKSWGGKKPLYDKNGANAKKNIRVEVEILDQ